MGLIKSNIGDWDNFFAKQICENLFQTSSASYGLDLPALNVQRGRDHGLQRKLYFCILYSYLYNSTWFKMLDCRPHQPEYNPYPPKSLVFDADGLNIKSLKML